MINNADISSKYLYNNINTVLDINDLQKYFDRFRFDIIKYNINDYDDIFIAKRNNLVMRYHQNMITFKTNQLMLNNEKQFLWGCKPRSGKTIMIFRNPALFDESF